MRPSTRISEAGLALRGHSRVRSCSLLLALLFCLVARPGGAVPVVAEARVGAKAGDVHGAARTGVQRALSEAVRTVVRRHVRSPDLTDHDAAIRRAVLDHAPNYVLRYSTADENWEGLEVTVQVEAEVDRDRVLDRLTGAGVPVAALEVKPRLLLVALEPAAQPLLSPLARILGEAGYPLRVVDRPEPAGSEVVDRTAAPAPVEEGQVGAWARSEGCHLVLALEAPGAGTDPVEDAPAGPRSSWLDGMWYDPGGELVREEVAAVAWVVDSSNRLPLGRLQGAGTGRGSDSSEAAAAAAEDAGRDLGYAALERLEQSGWTPEGDVTGLQVRISGLTDPRLVEEIGVALVAVPEVQVARLVEVSRQQAIWLLELVDAGLDWAAVLSTAQLPRGMLRWDPAGLGGVFGPPAPGVVATPILGGEWLGL